MFHVKHGASPSAVRRNKFGLYLREEWLDIPSQEDVSRETSFASERIGAVQTYWIQVFNQRPLTPFPGNEMLSALLDVNFDSLCEQYGLNPQEISSARSHLQFLAAPEGIAPFFLLEYQPDNGSPLVIYHWNANNNAGARWLEEVLLQAGHPLVKSHLAQTQEILAISLRPSHLEDIGLLLAYEVARWAAAQGKGLVYGLDGTWYRLNQHQAFLPL